MFRFLMFALLLGALLVSPLIYSQNDDIFEDSSSYGYDVKKQTEDEIFFYESRFVDLGLHAIGRNFTGGLAKSYGTGFGGGAFLAYYFTRKFALEVTSNVTYHRFLIDSVRGTAYVWDMLARGKYYFVSDRYSRGLSFANPYIFFGGGHFIRKQSRSDISAKNSVSGPGLEIGGGFEFALKEKEVYLGIKPSYQLVFFGDENQRTDQGTSLQGDLINFAVNLTYSF
jgi:hypothetical protein